MLSHAKELITEYCRREILVGINRSGQDDGKFSAGYIEGLEDDCFTLRFVDPYGFPGDGGNKTDQYRYDEINWIEAGTDYLRGLAVLANAFWSYVDVKKAEWSSNRQVIERELVDVVNPWKLAM